MIKISIAKLQAKSNDRPPDYMEHLMSVGKLVDDDSLEFDDVTYQELLNKYRSHSVKRGQMPDAPDPVELISNFGKAMTGWINSGFKVVPQEVFDKRAEICNACPFWDAKARLGLGKCNSKKCGCTYFKRWLATETCPEKKWPDYKVSSN